MAKHTQTKRFADELFESVGPFCEIGSYRFNVLFSPMILHKFTKSHIYHKVYIFPNCLVSRFSGVHLEPSERSKMKLTV